jgi:hypothetical protein
MAMAGRKRKTGYREANGRVSRVKEVSRYMDGFMDDPTAIYVLEALPLIKVGVSNAPNRRLKEIQTGNGQVVRSYWYRWMDGPAAKKLERAYHDLYQGKMGHSHGEWYYTPAEEVIGRLERLMRHMGLLCVRGEFSAQIERVCKTSDMAGR